mmetsp:Transcript_39688/g.78167  ORF Transcript_39688/g.78167 Transcript_39688/m.78167 type:complete len:234 (+) Transcript_39688:1886-2587(+)
MHLSALTALSAIITSRSQFEGRTRPKNGCAFSSFSTMLPILISSVCLYLPNLSTLDLSEKRRRSGSAYFLNPSSSLFNSLSVASSKVVSSANNTEKKSTHLPSSPTGTFGLSPCSPILLLPALPSFLTLSDRSCTYPLKKVGPLDPPCFVPICSGYHFPVPFTLALTFSSDARAHRINSSETPASLSCCSSLLCLTYVNYETSQIYMFQRRSNGVPYIHMFKLNCYVFRPTQM